MAKKTKTKGNKKNDVGRPTDYCKGVLVKAKEYLALCQDQDRNIDETLEPQSHGGALKREKKLKVKLPTRGGLAKYLGVSRDTLYEWAKLYKEFSDIMEQLGAEQEDRLINNGLSGDYNPTIAKVLLSKHGYREATEQELSTKDDKPISITYISPNDNKTDTETA